MLLNRLSPLHLLDEVERSFAPLTQSFAGTRPVLSPQAFPALNAWDDAEHFYLEADVPGLTLNNLAIFVTDGRVLTIKGERTECECENGKWLRRERGYGSFERQIDLPGPVNEEQVEASLKNGVLTITLPKAEEIRPRRIQVKAA